LKKIYILGWIFQSIFLMVISQKLILKIGCSVFRGAFRKLIELLKSCPKFNDAKFYYTLIQSIII